MPAETTSVGVVTTTANHFASMNIGGQGDQAGRSDRIVNLMAGDGTRTTVTIEVTAQDGTSTRNYTLYIDKLLPPLPAVSLFTSADRLRIQYRGAMLRTSPAPSTGDFTVVANDGTSDTTIGVTRLTVSGDSVWLTLGSDISSYSTVRLSYTRGANPIQNSAGTSEAAPFTNQLVTKQNLPVLITRSASAEEGEGLDFVVTKAGTNNVLEVSVAYATSVETGNNATEGADYARAAGTLTFAIGDTSKTISVTGREDEIDEDNETFTLTLSSPSNATFSGGADTLAATGTITDNDTRGVTITPTSLELNEEGSSTYTVVLGTRPTATVRVTPVVPSATDVSVSPTALTFSASGNSWSTVRTITVRAANDTDMAPDADVTISHEVTGGDYAGFSASSVTVTIVENDTPLSSPAINGNTLTLSSTANLDTTTTPATSAFTVEVDGTRVTVSGVNVAATTVTLTLADPVIRSTVVTVAYSPPSKDPLSFQDGGMPAIPALARTSVTNNTPASTDKTLSDISFNGTTVKGFDRNDDLRVYTTGVANSVSTAVLEASPNHAGAIVKVLGGSDDSVVNTAGRGETAEYGVSMSRVGDPYWFKIRVEPEDPAESPEIYDVIIGRQSTASRAWKVIDDLESGSLRAIGGLAGIWSDGTTVWVVDTKSSTVRAYEQDGTRDSSKDLTLDSDNDRPNGIWADDTTIYIGNSREATDLERNGLYAYRRSSRTPDSSKDLGIGDETTRTTLADFWSDGTTLWTVARGSTAVKAFNLDPDDFTEDSGQSFTAGPTASGIWSDGETFWIAGFVSGSPSDTAEIRAYNRSDKTRDRSRDIDIDGKNDAVDGLWSSDGSTLHSGNVGGLSSSQIFPGGPRLNKILSWNIPPSSTTDLTKLGLDGTDVTLVDGITQYTRTVVAGTTSVTVAASTLNHFATVNIDDEGAQARKSERTVTLTGIQTRVEIEATAQNGTNTATYTLIVNRALSPISVMPTLNVYGNLLFIDYTGQMLDTASVPSATDFTVTANDGTSDRMIGVTGVTISGSLVRLTLASAPTSSDTVFLTYARTTTPILNAAGDREAASFANRSVTVQTLPQISMAAAPSAEEGNTVDFVVTKSTNAYLVVTVAYATSVPTGNTATEGTDYTRAAGTLTFATNETTKTISVTTREDRGDEDNETFRLTLSTPMNATFSGGATTLFRTGTITDDDTRGLSLSDTSLTVTEGSSGTYTVALASQPTAQVVVTPTLPSDTDLSVSPAQLTFTTSNWETVRTVRVTARQDADGEDDTGITLSHSASGGDYGSVTGSLTVTIDDDDTPSTSYTLSASRANVLEGAGQTTVDVTARLDNSARTEDSVIAVSLSGGTATSGTDYTAVSAFTLTITAGQLEASGSFTFEPIEDRIDEADETVQIVGDAIGLDDTPATLTIQDNDAASTAILLSVDPASVREDTATTLVTVKAALNDAARNALTNVAVSVTGGTATSGTDYTAISNFTITIPSGATEATRSIPVAPDNDTTNEGNETIALTGASIGLTSGTATITITDDDAPSTAVTLSLDPTSVAEGASATTVTVTAGLNRAASTTDTDVRVAVVPGGTATPATDYAEITAFTITIPAGDQTKTGTFSFEPVDDNIDEPAETVELRGTASGLTAGTATLEVADNDAAPTGIDLTLSPTDVDEDGRQQNVQVTVALVGSLRSEATAVTVSVDDGTAEVGNDYSAVSAFTVTIPAAQQQGTGTLRITTLDDSVYEGNETVTVKAESTSPALSDTASLQITEDDTESTSFTLSLNPASVSEGADATTVTVTARLDEATRTTDTVVRVTVGASSDSATSGTDYGAVSAFSFTIPKGQQQASGTFSIDPQEDTLSEGAETATVQGEASGLGDAAVDLSITDNESAPTQITLSVDPATVMEDASSTTVAVKAVLDGSPRQASTDVEVSVANSSTATSGTDYTAISTFTITIPGGASEATRNIPVQPLDDATNEGSETIVLSATSTGLTSGAATITITDDDTPSTAVTLSVNPTSVGEDAGASTVTVTAGLNAGARTRDTDVEVTVGPQGTATVVADYARVTAFTITIPAGDRTKTDTFPFVPVDDNIDEASETVQLTGKATGLSDGTANLTINDDDDAPTGLTISLSPTRVDEDGGRQSVEVTATLVGSTQTVATTVAVTVAADTATQGDDYQVVPSFNVTIPATESSGKRTFNFVPVNDAVAEGTEQVTVRGQVTSPSLSGTASLQINDDDSPSTSYTLSARPATFGEGDDATVVNVTARLDAAARTQDTEILMSLSGGTATSGTDYETVSAFTVEIDAGQLQGNGSFTFEPIDDRLDEENETVQVRGSATGLTDTPATLTITDNDVSSTRILLTVDPDNVDENVASTSVTVKAALDEAALDIATDVLVSVANTSTATSGTDYTAISSFTITIPIASTEATRTIAVRPVDDSTSEGDETIVLTGTSSGLTDGRATITITDDDAPSTAVTLSVNPSRVEEDLGATTVTVTAGLNRAARLTDTDVRVAVVSGGTATPTTDYAEITAFTITIPAGEQTETETFPFEPVGDDIDEPDETVQLRATASGLTAATTSLEITDDDPAPTGLEITLSPTRVNDEDGGRQTPCRGDGRAGGIRAVRSDGGHRQRRGRHRRTWATTMQPSARSHPADHRGHREECETQLQHHAGGTPNDSVSEGNEAVTVIRRPHHDRADPLGYGVPGDYRRRCPVDELHARDRPRLAWRGPAGRVEVLGSVTVSSADRDRDVHNARLDAVSEGNEPGRLRSTPTSSRASRLGEPVGRDRRDRRRPPGRRITRPLRRPSRSRSMLASCRRPARSPSSPSMTGSRKRPRRWRSMAVSPE